MKTHNFAYQGARSLAKICQTPEFERQRSRSSACLVQIYSGEIDAEKLAKLGQEIRQVLPDAHILGATSAGEILHGRITENKIVIAISFFENTTLTSRLWEKAKSQTDEELGREVGAMAGPQTRLLLLFSTALNVEGGALVRGISATAPETPIAGGGAGDNNEMKRCLILHGTQVSDCGVVVVALHSNTLQVWCRQSLDWQPVGKKMTLDRVEGQRLLRIDGRPAGETYDRYLGVEAQDGSVSERAREFPLIINRNGLEISRIAAYRLPDGSLAFPSDLKEGEQAQFSMANIEMMLETANTMVEELSHYPIEAAFIFSCTVRRGALQSAADQETLPFCEIGTVAGFFTYGEYFHQPQCNQVLNGAMSVVGLSEKPLRAFSPSTDKSAPRIRAHLPSSLRVFATMAHLMKAVNSEVVPTDEPLSVDNFISFNTGDKIEKIYYPDIIAIEAEGNYTRIHLRRAGSLLVRLTMKKWTDVLPRSLFLSLHRSLIIQTAQIERWEMTSRETGQLFLAGMDRATPISRQSVRLLRQLEN